MFRGKNIIVFTLLKISGQAFLIFSCICVIFLSVSSCGQASSSKSKSFSTPTQQNPTDTPTQQQTGVVMAPDPTQDPNAPQLTYGGMNSMLSSCAPDCNIDFFLAKPGTMEIVNYSTPIHWTATSDVSGVILSPSSGTISSADTTRVTSFPTPCQKGLIIISTPDLPTHQGRIEIPLLCDPQLTLTLTDGTMLGQDSDLSTTTPGCSFTSSATVLTCTIILARTGTFQGDVQWSTTSDASDAQEVPASLQPSGGTITASQSISITILGLTCNTQGGAIRFFWNEGTESYGSFSLNWRYLSCPALTATPSS